MRALALTRPAAAALLTLLCLGLTAAPAAAQSLQERIDGRRDGTLILPPGEVAGRANIDGPLTVAGDPESPTRLTAPGDEVVLAVWQGGELTMSGATLTQTEGTRFALYVDGGRVVLEDCRIEGAFETAIVVQSGSVALQRCDIAGPRLAVSLAPGAAFSWEDGALTGWGEAGIVVNAARLWMTGLRLEGPAPALALQEASETALSDVSIAGSGGDLVYLSDGAQLSAEALSIRGQAGAALVAQSAGALTLRDLEIAGDFAEGLIVEGAESVRLDSGKIAASKAPLVLRDIPGGAEVAKLLLQAGPEGYGLRANGVFPLSARHLRIAGGDVGVFLSGALQGGIVNSDLTGQSLYAIALQEVAESEESPLIFADNRIVSGGIAVPFAGYDGGSVALEGNSLIAAGDVAILLENTGLAGSRDNLIAAAPFERARTVALYEAGRALPRLLDDGAVAPIDGGSLGQSDRRYSLADLAALPWLDPDTRRAIADFAEAKTADAAALLLALSLAAAEEGERTAETLTLVSLAPPPETLGEDLTWAPDAWRIVLQAPDGQEIFLDPPAFPIALPQGSYEVLHAGKRIGRIEARGGEAVFAMPLLEAPYLVRPGQEGGLEIGPFYGLRPPATLAALQLGRRPPEVGEQRGSGQHPVRRAGVTAEAAAMAVAEAQERIPALLRRHAAAQEAKDWPQENRARQALLLWLDLLAELAPAETADWLLALDGTLSARIQMGYAAVRIEARHGRLTDGAVAAWLADRPLDSQDWLANSIVEAAARSGAPFALDRLADLHLAKRAEAGPEEPVVLGLSTLWLAPPERALPLYRDFLGRLQRQAAAVAKGEADKNAPAIYRSAWEAASIAMGLLAARGTPEDRALFALPLAPAMDIRPLVSLVEEPAALMALFYGLHGEVPAWRVENLLNTPGASLCQALALRPAETRAAIVRDLRAVQSEATIPAYWPDYETMSAEERRSVHNHLDFRWEMGAGECRIKDIHLGLTLSESAAAEEERKFDRRYDPLWWQRPAKAAERLAAVAADEDYARAPGLGPYPHDWVMARIGPDADPDIAAALETHHRLLTDAWMSPYWFHAFGAERRIFRIRDEEGSGQRVFAGHIDVRPLPSEGDLLVAIRHTIETRDHGGLAAAMTAPDRAPYETPDRRRMFERVALEQESAEGIAVSEGEYIAPLPDGGHLWRLPWNGSLDNSWLRIGMRFDKTRWSLDIALHAADVAVAQRLRQGPKEEQPR